jgi:hypothetical protein
MVYQNEDMPGTPPPRSNRELGEHVITLNTLNFIFAFRINGLSFGPWTSFAE